MNDNLPLILWDGECGVCAKWVKRWEERTHGEVRYVPCQEFEADEEGRLKDYPIVNVRDCARAVQLIIPDGERYEAAEAVFWALAYTGHGAWLWLYGHLPGFKTLSELAYRFVARHRSWF